MNLDINVLFFIFNHLSYRDIANLCATNRKYFRLYKKHSELIWQTLLLRDFNLESSEIIGEPMSYYIGLKENIGNFYSFDKILNYTTYEGEGFRRRLTGIENITPITENRAEKIGLTIAEFMEEQNNFFQIPAMSDLFPCNASGEKIWLGYHIASPKSFGEEIRTFAVGKTLDVCKRFLEKQSREAFIDYDTPRGWSNPRFLIDHETSCSITSTDVHAIDYKISYGFFEIVLP